MKEITHKLKSRSFWDGSVTGMCGQKFGPGYYRESWFSVRCWKPPAPCDRVRSGTGFPPLSYTSWSTSDTATAFALTAWASYNLTGGLDPDEASKLIADKQQK